jgi:N-terminal domain of galactosyltransferase
MTRQMPASISGDHTQKVTSNGVCALTLSVVVTWCNRIELQRALAASLPILSTMTNRWELVLVNGGGDPTLLQALLADISGPNIRTIDVNISPFNKAQCINIGVFHCCGELLLLLDADIIIDHTFPDAVLHALDTRSFVSIKTVFETEPEILPGFDPQTSFLTELVEVAEFVGDDGRRASYEFRRGRDGSRCGPGIVLVHRSHFLQIGGFNSAFEGWGFEDYDFQLRLQFGLGLARKTLHFVTHITHPPWQNQRQTSESNRMAAYRNYALRCFTGSFQRDVQVFQEQLISSQKICS